MLVTRTVRDPLRSSLPRTWCAAAVSQQRHFCRDHDAGRLQPKATTYMPEAALAVVKTSSALGRHVAISSGVEIVVPTLVIGAWVSGTCLWVKIAATHASSRDSHSCRRCFFSRSWSIGSPSGPHGKMREVAVPCRWDLPTGRPSGRSEESAGRHVEGTNSRVPSTPKNSLTPQHFQLEDRECGRQSCVADGTECA